VHQVFVPLLISFISLDLCPSVPLSPFPPIGAPIIQIEQQQQQQGELSTPLQCFEFFSFHPLPLNFVISFYVF